MEYRESNRDRKVKGRAKAQKHPVNGRFVFAIADARVSRDRKADAKAARKAVAR